MSALIREVSSQTGLWIEEKLKKRPCSVDCWLYIFESKIVENGKTYKIDIYLERKQMSLLVDMGLLKFRLYFKIGSKVVKK